MHINHMYNYVQISDLVLNKSDGNSSLLNNVLYIDQNYKC